MILIRGSQGSFFFRISHSKTSKRFSAGRSPLSLHLRFLRRGRNSCRLRWTNVSSYSPVDDAPNELHATLRQMFLGKAAGENEATAERLKFGRGKALGDRC